ENGVIDLRAQDAADPRREDERARILVVAHPQVDQSPTQLKIACGERRDQQHPERADRERTDMKKLLDHAAAPRIGPSYQAGRVTLYARRSRCPSGRTRGSG